MGNSSGPAAPNVGGPGYTGYTAPANWGNPAVTGHDLMVHTGTLRSVASQLGMLATQLEHALGNWQAQAGAAASGTSAGSWPAALSLNTVIGKAHRGVLQFTGELQKAHNDMQTRLTQSADNYDAAEQHVASIANRSTDPTATIIGSGGNNSAAVPTPQQERVLALEHHMDPGAGSAENWQQTLPIVEDSSFDAGGTSGYTWDSVRAQLDGTDSGAIKSAGEAYTTLYSTLTDIAGKLPGQGTTLAADWGGVNAVTAVSQVQQLHQTASDMQANTFAAGAALKYYGAVLDTFKSNLPAAGSTPTSGAHAAAANQAAQQYMQALNGHVQSAYYNMPGAVNKNLPPPLTTTGGSGTTGGVGYGGANGGGVGGAGGGGTSGGGAPGMSAPGGTAPVPGLPAPGGTTPGGTTPAGTVPGGTVPGAPPPGSITPPPTKLAGVGPGLGITPAGPGPGPGSVGTPPPVTTTPGGPGPGVGVLPPPPVTPIGPGGPGGSGGVRPGGPGGSEPVPGGGDPVPPEVGVGPGVPGLTEPVPPDVPGITPAGVITGQSGPGGLAGSGGLAGEDGLVASGDVAAGEAMGGPGMMPMMGGIPGGAGQGGVGRERESWTSEENGTFGPDAAAADSAGAAADGAFPGMMPFGAGSSGQRQERDRNRLMWMSEEDDLWGAGQPATPPVISQD